jgi:hypothetical protein
VACSGLGAIGPRLTAAPKPGADRPRKFSRLSPAPWVSPYQVVLCVVAIPEIPRHLCEDALPGAQVLRFLEQPGPLHLRFPGGSDHILQGVEVEGARDDVITDNEARCSVNI